MSNGVEKLAIDCRVARISGIGVSIRSLVPLCMAALPETRFRLIGHDDAFSPPAGSVWEAAACDAPIYSLAEQIGMPKLLKGCDALWTPHYPIPLLARRPLVVAVHDLAWRATRDGLLGSMGKPADVPPREHP